PAANRGNMHKHRALVRSRAEQAKAQYIETRLQGEAKERAMQAARENRPVIIVGGDGSVHEVVNGILASGNRVPLGIVAAGSGNDFAWNTLKLPHDPAEAIERAFAGQLIDVDAGIVNERYFVNSLGIGLDADIAVAATMLKKYPFMSGARLYYAATLKRALKLLPIVKRGEHEDLPEVRFYRAKSINITSRNPVNIHMDGETTCAASYKAEIMPGALSVRV